MTQTTLVGRFLLTLAAAVLSGALLGNATLAAEEGQPAPARIASIPTDPIQAEPKSLPTQLLPPLQVGQSKAARWLQLLDQATLVETWQEPLACRNQPSADRTGMCRLQWRKRGGLSSLRGRYDDYSYEMTRRLAGEHLADHLEFDIDRNPEIRLRYEFE